MNLSGEEIVTREDLPVLLLQLLHQRVVYLGVHRRENTLIRDCAIKDLFDGCVTQNVSNSSFQKCAGLETRLEI